jgi:tRNA(fMet)-specific endonuclease VapC
MTYLIDTDLVIDGLHNRSMAIRLFESLALSSLSVSIISLGELYEGAYIFPNPEQHLVNLRQFLDGFQVLGLNDEVMMHFARERAMLRRQGLLIPDFDLVIAATAVTHGLTLVTRNLRHFERITDLQVHQPS